MAADIFFSVVGKLAECAIDPLLCQLKYMICYNSKIRTLENKVKDLETKETEVRELVRQAQNNVLDIKSYVEEWLQNVDEIKKAADKIFEDAKTSKNSEMQCLFLRCPNLKTRYWLGRNATEKTAEVANLLEGGKLFQNVAEPRQLVQIPHQNPGDFGAFETRISIKKEIMDALKDKDVSIIGICGMGGVGKTTMAKEIANKAKVDKLFDEFAWADISGDPKVTKIQDELAERLGLDIKGITNESVRAGLLRKRLGGGRSILVILDDVWENTVLETIGVPSAGDDKKLKILLTSRDKDVCKRMKAQRIFDVHLLNEKESWELFKEKAEISDDATDVIKDTAEKIAKECDGLPLALVIVGRALSGKEEHELKNALVELRSSAATNIQGVPQSVYSRIELSYKYLESDEAKSLFLLCSLYPEDSDIAIEDLVRYAWGLELFRGTMTLITTRDRVNTIVDHLKSCYLLLSAEDKDSVRLHDVVRDVCLQIASKDNMSKHTGLKEWPKHDNNESYSAISLASNELNQLPSGLEYPDLKFLRVICKKQSLNISKEFFADMKELRVLDFTAMGIQIPSSIQLLTNLRTLCLDHCALNIGNFTFGNLKKLEVLSFFGSALDHFPEDIAELSNLRLLDLRLEHRSSYCPLPPGILLQLKNLEELYLGVVEISDDELEQRGYIIKEISSLTSLNTFQISTNDPQFLLQILHVCIEKLERFHIELTDLEYAHENILEYYYFGRRLHIRGITYASMLSQHAINSLMRRTGHLYIEMDLNNLDDLSLRVMERKNMLDEDGFEYLNGNHPTGAFEGLQVINLNGMPKMKHLFRGVIKPPSLCNLMFLTIKSCPSLKSLFSESVASCMVNLHVLTIRNCGMLEEIISMDTEQIEVTQMLEFPKLQSIFLSGLRNFKRFRCESNKTVGVHNPLFKQVTLPNLERLDIDGLGCSVTVWDELRQIRSQKLELAMRNLDDVFILFDFEYTKDDAKIRMLGQLTSLVVRSLPKLEHITRMFHKGICSFKNLTHLTVEKCDNLRYLFSPSMANSLVALEDLLVRKCKAIEEIIGRQEDKKKTTLQTSKIIGRQEEDNTSNIEIVEEGTTSRIVFPKLRYLQLHCLDRFRLLFSQNYELVFPSLECLLIENCPSLKSLFSESVASCTVNLQDLTICNCEMLEEIISMDMTQNEVTQMLEFPKLQRITLEDLRNFKSFRCGSNKTVGVLNPLFKQVTLPNLERLEIHGLDCTVTILDELRQIGSHKLRALKMRDLDDVSILFDFEYTKDDAEIRMLGQLKSLDVACLPELVHITRMFPKGICIFKNLTRLKVEGCDNLRYLFSPSMANSLVALERLMVQNCKAIEEVIGTQEEDNTSNIEIVEEGTTSKVVFPKLRRLELLHLDRFRLLSSRNYELVLPSLEYLCIENCPMMTKLCPRRLLSAPKLDKVWINREQSIDISNFLDFEDVREPQIC